MPVTLMTLWRRLIVDPVATRASIKLPSLVWAGPPAEHDEWGSWQPTSNGTRTSRPGAGEALIFTVEKVLSAVNPFPMGVTIGRVETNDVIVDDASVSRFHAWLQLDERKGVWSLTDAESHNGTWVNGVRCEPKKKVPLSDGAEVRVGDASLRFFLPEALIAHVTEHGDSGRTVP
jgi:hypothetical protein